MVEARECALFGAGEQPIEVVVNDPSQVAAALQVIWSIIAGCDIKPLMLVVLWIGDHVGNFQVEWVVVP